MVTSAPRLRPSTSAPGLGSPCHVCTGTGLTPATSAPGLGSPLPHLHRDWPTQSGLGTHRAACAHINRPKLSCVCRACAASHCLCPHPPRIFLLATPPRILHIAADAATALWSVRTHVFAPIEHTVALPNGRLDSLLPRGTVRCGAAQAEGPWPCRPCACRAGCLTSPHLTSRGCWKRRALYACCTHAVRVLYACCTRVVRMLHACCTHVARMAHGVQAGDWLSASLRRRLPLPQLEEAPSQAAPNAPPGTDAPFRRPAVERHGSVAAVFGRAPVLYEVGRARQACPEMRPGGSHRGRKPWQARVLRAGAWGGRVGR